MTSKAALAPQTVFVETDGALTPREVAQLLGGELENQQRKYPRSVLSDAENVAIQRARTDAEMRALMGGKAAVFASGHSTAWSVLYRELDGSGADEDVASLMSPLNRTVNVVAVPRFVGRCQKTDFLPWLAAELRCRCGFNQTVWSCGYIGRGRCESHLSAR